MFRTTARLPIAAAAIAVAAVIAACGSSSRGGGDHPPDAQMQQQLVSFANCMRSHGVPDLPDPATSPHAFKSALNTKSPAFEAAFTTCHHLLPDGGESSHVAAPSRTQIAAALSFARCMRAHGFESFPDPSSDGELNHEMLAAAGIDLHQPAFVQAADACVGTTHGLLTKRGVARFIAGQ